MKNIAIALLFGLLAAGLSHGAAFKATFTGNVTTAIPLFGTVPAGVVGETAPGAGDGSPYEFTVIANNNIGVDGQIFGEPESFSGADILEYTFVVGANSIPLSDSGSNFTVTQTGPNPLDFSAWNLAASFAGAGTANLATGGGNVVGPGGGMPAYLLTLGNASVSVQAIPEPSTVIAFVALLGCGGFWLRRRRQQA